MADPVIYRYEVPVDDQWHPIDLSGEILHVAARRPDVVELWAEAHVGRMWLRQFRVFGTGQPLPQKRGVHIGTALAADGRLVWHLYARAEGERC